MGKKKTQSRADVLRKIRERHKSPNQEDAVLRLVRALSRNVQFARSTRRVTVDATHHPTVAEVWEQIVELKGGNDLLRRLADYTCRRLDKTRIPGREWRFRQPFSEKVCSNLADAVRVATALRMEVPPAGIRQRGGRCFALTTPGGIAYFTAVVFESHPTKGGYSQTIQLNLLPVAPGTRPR